jgi:hypothetical protein
VCNDEAAAVAAEQRKKTTEINFHTLFAVENKYSFMG